MNLPFLCGRDEVRLELPDDATVYESFYPEPPCSTVRQATRALREPVGAPPLRQALAARGPGDVVIVVSDVTRPIPYADILPPVLEEMEAAGVSREEIVLLIATGMHRASTPHEREEMFGEAGRGLRIEDHDATDDANLVELPAPSWSGARVRVNRTYMEAGFRLVTGLVEPHFMAGFSGGRKSLCPGLVALETIRNFHGHKFLDNPRTRNGNLLGNPLHEEALSVARLAGVDMLLNVVLDRERRVVATFAGDLEAAHGAACDFVVRCACPTVHTQADAVVTSCGGYPLDATFYQCVKGFVSCLPAVRHGGEIVAFGGCSEGIGSPEYTDVMQRYATGWERFLEDIRRPEVFMRDQWQFQMHTQTLQHVGAANLHFVTPGVYAAELERMNVVGHAVPAGHAQRKLQNMVDALVADDKTIAAFPEGPYCGPVPPAD